MGIGYSYDERLIGSGTLNKCIGDNTKADARQNCIGKQKIKTAKTIFNMADGILSPYNCGAACGSGMTCH